MNLLTLIVLVDRDDRFAGESYNDENDRIYDEVSKLLRTACLAAIGDLNYRESWDLSLDIQEG